jgi:suppressor of tumorigenicity protein 13
MMFGGATESILVDRANCLIACSRPRAAIADCTAALDLNRYSARAFRCRGVAYRLLGFWEEAKADISAGQHINYETGFDDLQVFLNHKVIIFKEPLHSFSHFMRNVFNRFLE